MSIPGLLLLLTILSLAGRGLLQIILVLGISSGVTNSRVVRSAVIAIKENDYFRAARAVGGPLAQTLRRHVLPNVMPPIIIIFSITIGAMIVAEASLSLLGCGVEPAATEPRNGRAEATRSDQTSSKPTLLNATSTAACRFSKSTESAGVKQSVGDSLTFVGSAAQSARLHSPALA